MKSKLMIVKSFNDCKYVAVCIALCLITVGAEANGDTSVNDIKDAAAVVQFGVHYEYPFGGMARRNEWIPKGEDDWRRDIARIKQTGFNSIRIRIGFDSDLDDVAKLLDVIHEHGMTVIFGFATFYVNDHFIETYPDSKIIGGNGEVGPRDKNDVRWQRACIDHPVYRTRRNKLIADCVSRFGKHPAVIVWDIHNEPSIGPVHNGCFCKNSLKKYRDELRKEFGQIGTLNKKFHVGYKDFNQVRPPAYRTAANEEFYIHWRSYMANDLNNFLTEGRDIVAKEIPTAMITHNVTGFESLPSKGQDWWLFKDGYKLLSMSRYTGTDEKSVAGTLGYEVLKAMNPDKLHWIEEFQGGPFPVPGLKVLYSGKEAEIELNGALSHGFKGVYFYRWDPLLSGPEPQVNGMTEPDGIETDRRIGIQKAIKALQPHLSFIAHSQPLKPSVGIYFTRNQVMKAEGDSLALAGLNNSGIANFESGAYQLLSDLGYEAACIVHGVDGLSKYKVVVFPYVADLTDQEISAIEKFVADGGSAVIDLSPFDHRTIERFSRVFGLQAGKSDILSYFPGFNITGWSVRGMGKLNVEDNAFAGYCFNERIALKGNDVILKYDDNGEGAAVMPSKYNGRLLISGCRLFYSYGISMHPRTRQLVQSFLGRIIPPDINMEGTGEEFRPYVEARVLENQDSDSALLFVMNRCPHKSYELNISVKDYEPVKVKAPAYDVVRVILQKKKP
ncbi:MAG: beta-galactosidase [Chitinophagaceae bacterium]|nr:beta-galactosidase [Chitinophagaceae bacterium]